MMSDAVVPFLDLSFSSASSSSASSQNRARRGEETSYGSSPVQKTWFEGSPGETSGVHTPSPREVSSSSSLAAAISESPHRRVVDEEVAGVATPATSTKATRAVVPPLAPFRRALSLGGGVVVPLVVVIGVASLSQTPLPPPSLLHHQQRRHLPHLLDLATICASHHHRSVLFPYLFRILIPVGRVVPRSRPFFSL